MSESSDNTNMNDQNSSSISSSVSVSTPAAASALIHAPAPAPPSVPIPAFALPTASPENAVLQYADISYTDNQMVRALQKLNKTDLAAYLSARSVAILRNDTKEILVDKVVPLLRALRADSQVTQPRPSALMLPSSIVSNVYAQQSSIQQTRWQQAPSQGLEPLPLSFWSPSDYDTQPSTAFSTHGISSMVTGGSTNVHSGGAFSGQPRGQKSPRRGSHLKRSDALASFENPQSSEGHSGVFSPTSSVGGGFHSGVFSPSSSVGGGFPSGVLSPSSSVGGGFPSGVLSPTSLSGAGFPSEHSLVNAGASTIQQKSSAVLSVRSLAKQSSSSSSSSSKAAKAAKPPPTEEASARVSVSDLLIAANYLIWGGMLQPIIPSGRADDVDEEARKSEVTAFEMNTIMSLITVNLSKRAFITVQEWEKLCSDNGVIFLWGTVSGHALIKKDKFGGPLNIEALFQSMRNFVESGSLDPAKGRDRLALPPSDPRAVPTDRGERERQIRIRFDAIKKSVIPDIDIGEPPLQ